MTQEAKQMPQTTNHENPTEKHNEIRVPKKFAKPQLMKYEACEF